MSLKSVRHDWLLILAMLLVTVGTIVHYDPTTKSTFHKDGITTQFFRQNGRFMVRTDGPDGQLADFEIQYTFGVTPLQQYLIELPGGRL